MTEDVEQRVAKSVRKKNSPMNVWGQIMIWTGVAIWTFAVFAMDTAIDGTVNLSLQHKQELTCLTALFMFSTGVIVAALGAIHVSIRRWAAWQGFGRPVGSERSGS